MTQAKPMKQVLLLSFCFILLSFPLLAQEPEFKVSSFTHQDNSMLARMSSNLRLDVNDEAAALILVRTAETGVGFTSNTGTVGEANWKTGDYWVYVPQGARSLKIFKKGIKTIEYTFETIPKSKETYLLELEVIRPEPKVAILPVTIITQPENANLSIDGKTISGQTKTHQLSEGEHIVIIQMPGHETLEKSISVNKNNAYFNFTLNEISNAALMVESQPAGATVYLDGISLGTTPFSVFYPPGTYPIRVVKQGYISIEDQELTVVSPETRKSYTLEENAGWISINTFETAKVSINGTEYANTQNLKFPPQLLNIRVSMPKSEDLEKQVILKRNEQLSIDLYPDIATGSLEIAVTPFDAQVEITGDAGEYYTSKGMKIFKDIPVGSYSIIVSADGYSSEAKTVKLTAKQVVSQNIKLKEGYNEDIEVVFVKGDSFQMGSSDDFEYEKPEHILIVSDFYIGKYEVTQKQWKEIMGTSTSHSSPSSFKGDELPVEQVSWTEIQEFIKKLNQKTNKKYRLPTEAEWEYAARGGNQSKGYTYSGSNKIDEVAWHSGNSGSKTHSVGTKKANELGIYDMSGNVWEWCSDWYGSDYYKFSPSKNPKGPSSGAFRIARGGSWHTHAQYCRTSHRTYYAPGRNNIIGFRLALSM